MERRGAQLMTKTRRVINIIEGVIIFIFGVILVAFPTESVDSVLALIGLGMSLRGIRALLYYFSMAKHMVGGRSVLYRGMIFLDAGILTSTLADAPALSVIVYIAIITAFAGVVSILRARESRSVGSPRWKGIMILGVANIVMAVSVIVCGFVLRVPDAAVYVYAIGLFSSAIGKILSAFRRTAIVYIQ